MIIGISGRKQSGKSTVGMFLVEHLENVSMVNFADELKELCALAYGAPQRNLHGSDADKNEVLPSCGLTGRVLMQRLGQAMREIWPECWVHAWGRRTGLQLAGGHVKHIVVADVRYPNEVRAIHNLGGVVVRLERGWMGKQQEGRGAGGEGRREEGRGARGEGREEEGRGAGGEGVDRHESETALDMCQVIEGNAECGTRNDERYPEHGVWFDLALNNDVLGIEQTNALVLRWIEDRMEK